MAIDRRTLLVNAAALGAMVQAPKVLGQTLARVAFVHVGPTGDFGWSFAHDQARIAVEQHFGGAVEVITRASVPEGAAAEAVLRELAAGGATLIFATSFGYMNAVIKVAGSFPDVKFEHCTGFQRARNVATYNAAFHEGRAVIGALMGEMSRSGIGGYIAGVRIPEVVAGINATLLGAREVNPRFRLKVQWINAWHDPEREAAAAESLLNSGADVLSQHTDSVRPLQVAEARGAYGFGQAADMAEFAPHAQLTALIYNWAPYCISRVQALLDRSWTPGDTLLGLRDGTVQLAPFGPAVTERAAQRARIVMNSIAEGRRGIFVGPISDQSGRERVAPGEALTGAQILSLDWLAAGVEG